MPRTFVNYLQYKTENIGSVIRAKVIQRKKTVGELAKCLGVTRQGMSYKLSSNVFTYEDLLLIIDFLELTDYEILELMRLKEA